MPSTLRQVFHPAMYRFDEPVASYWEASAQPVAYSRLEAETSVDIAVVGGGYTGLSAALHAARDFGADVAVLEAGHIGWGASGRNAGFACIPATKLSTPKLIERYGLDEAKKFFAAQIEGTRFTRALIEDNGIDADITGDRNFAVAEVPGRMAELAAEVEAYTKLFGIEARTYTAEEFREIGHDGSPEQFGAMDYRPGFAIHPLKFLVGLGRTAAAAGARLFANSPVVGWEKTGDRHRLRTPHGTLSARRVVLATSGFTPDGLHTAFDRRVLPAISNIIVTRPLTEAEWQVHRFLTTSPLLNARHLLTYYRRLPDGRLLIGERGDWTGRPDHGERMKQQLVRRLGEIFPAWQGIEVQYFWRGLVDLTRKLTPSLGRLDDDPSVWYGFGYHANGVNSAPWTGRALARAICGSNSGELEVPAVMRGLPARLPPFGMLSRRLTLAAAYAHYRREDAKVK